jgi:hypothetical protein
MTGVGDAVKDMFSAWNGGNRVRRHMRPRVLPRSSSSIA